MSNGYIKLDRALFDWRYATKPDYVALWIHMLLKANHKDKEWQDITIRRGQLVTSLESLSKGTGISVQKVRTILDKLDGEELTRKSTNKYTLITILKYDDTNKQINNQLTNNQQTTNKQLTTNNNDKNDKNEKNNKYYVPDRTEKNFIIPTIQEIESYCIENGYSTVSAEKFYDYYQKNDWTVKSKGKRKKMQNWKLALNNWVLNEIRYNETNDLRNRSREAYIKDVEMRQKAEEKKQEGGNWFDQRRNTRSLKYIKHFISYGI